MKIGRLLGRLRQASVFPHFSATNLEMAVNYSIPIEVVNEGAVTIPAKLFSEYVGLLREEHLELNVIEGLTLSMTTKGSHTKIKCIAAEEFPHIAAFDEVSRVKLSREELARFIPQVAFAAALENARPVNVSF